MNKPNDVELAMQNALKHRGVSDDQIGESVRSVGYREMAKEVEEVLGGPTRGGATPS